MKTTLFRLGAFMQGAGAALLVLTLVVSTPLAPLHADEVGPEQRLVIREICGGCAGTCPNKAVDDQNTCLSSGGYTCERTGSACIECFCDAHPNTITTCHCTK